MKKSTVAVSAALLFSLAASVWACSVPVFRYALERWQADPYEVLVFHRGELSPADRAVAEKLSADGEAGQLHANVNLTLVNLDADPDPQLVEIWESQQSPTLPWMTVRYPVPTRIPVDAYSGPLTDENVARLLQSPARAEIAKRLLSGDTAVLVLLESGQAEQDNEAFSLVERQAEQLAQTLELPEIAPEDLDEVSVDPTALKLRFSTIRLSRDDPAEQMLVDMLLGSEEDLRELEGPMAFPVFGRGRVLYALIGAGITQENVQQAGVDLTGPCTCTVKDQNPGVDLVMAVDWDNLVEQKVETDKALPPLAGLAGFPEEQPAGAEPAEAETAAAEQTNAETIVAAAGLLGDETIAEEPLPPQAGTSSGGHAAGGEQSGADSMWRNLLFVASAAVLILFAASMVVFRKKT